MWTCKSKLLEFWDWLYGNELELENVNLVEIGFLNVNVNGVSLKR